MHVHMSTHLFFDWVGSELPLSKRNASVITSVWTLVKTLPCVPVIFLNEKRLLHFTLIRFYICFRWQFLLYFMLDAINLVSHQVVLYHIAEREWVIYISYTMSRVIWFYMIFVEYSKLYKNIQNNTHRASVRVCFLDIWSHGNTYWCPGKK